MKVSRATISFLLLLFLFLTVTLGTKTESFSGGPFHPAECCFSYITQAIPHHRITDYYETGSECPKPGVVFITRKNRLICANPKHKWVQDYLKELEEK